MQDQLGKAERYRKEAARYHERAKLAQPAYLGNFFRQVAVRYMFMAQEAECGQRGARDPRPPGMQCRQNPGTVAAVGRLAE